MLMILTFWGLVGLIILAVIVWAFLVLILLTGILAKRGRKIVTPTPAPPTPTPTPKHVTITVYYQGPPNMEAGSIIETLNEPAKYGYFGENLSVTIVGVNNQTYNQIIGTTSTGQVQILPWGDINAVAAWINAQLA